MTDTSANTQALHPQRWLALAVLLAAGFMNWMDVTIVNVALPSMQTNMGATSSQIEWVVAGYVLAFAVFLLPFGRLGDIVGRRRIFLFGVAAFTAVSAICGLAPNVEMLVVARVLQGVAGAALMPQVLAIVQDLFQPNERAKAFAFFGMSAGVASVTGPLIGGFLIDLNIAGLDWRPIFLINIPIGLAVIFLGLRTIPKLPGNARLTVDWGGMAIVSLAVFCLVFPLVEGRTFEWPTWIFIMMAASVPVFIGFVVFENFRSKNNASQLLPMTLIANRNYMVGTFVVMAFFSGLPGLFMILALFLQSGFGLSPFESGLATSPFPLGILVASAAISRFGARFMRQRLVLGMLVLIGAMFLIRQTILGVSGQLHAMDFFLPLFLSGLGAGVVISVIFQSVLANVPAQDSGSGSGGLQAFQQMGAAIGIAIVGQIFFSTLLADGFPTPDAFKDAAAAAIVYDICIFSLVIIASFFMPTRGHGELPENDIVPMEA